MIIGGWVGGHGGWTCMEKKSCMGMGDGDGDGDGRLCKNR